MLRTLKKSMLWLVVFFAAVFVYGRIAAYLEDRAFKKVQTEEYFRRQAMTPEARLAEDAAKTKANAERQEAANRKRIYDLGVIACLAKWKSSLLEPDSGVVVGFEGDVGSSGNFYGLIVGRAKNRFGAVIPRRTSCRITHSNGESSMELIDE